MRVFAVVFSNAGAASMIKAYLDFAKFVGVGYGEYDEPTPGGALVPVSSPKPQVVEMPPVLKTVPLAAPTSVPDATGDSTLTDPPTGRPPELLANDATATPDDFEVYQQHNPNPHTNPADQCGCGPCSRVKNAAAAGK